MPRRRVGGVVLVAALALLVAGCTTTGADEQTRSANQQGYVGTDGSLTQIAPQDRKAVPVISGTALGGDKTVSTSDYAGKVIVLNVWGSWCAPCREEAADLQAASVETEQVAQFVGINTRDFATAAPEAFVRAKGITYPSIYDPDGKVALLDLSADTRTPPSAIPSTLVVDRQGRLAVRILSPISKTTLVDIIDDVAAGR